MIGHDKQFSVAGGNDTTGTSVAGADEVPGADRVSASTKAASVNQDEDDDAVETAEPVRRDTVGLSITEFSLFVFITTRIQIRER